VLHFVSELKDPVPIRATGKVKDMTLAYRIQRPNDRVSKVIATLAATIAHAPPRNSGPRERPTIPAFQVARGMGFNNGGTLAS
jgi:hypothetical protein